VSADKGTFWCGPQGDWPPTGGAVDPDLLDFDNPTLAAIADALHEVLAGGAEPDDVAELGALVGSWRGKYPRSYRKLAPSLRAILDAIEEAGDVARGRDADSD